MKLLNLLITTDRLYSGVESVDKYGCRGGLNYLQLNDRYICPTCSVSVENQRSSLHQPDPFNVSATLFLKPPVGSFEDTNDVSMSEADRKRASADQSIQTPNKKPHGGSD